MSLTKRARLAALIELDGDDGLRGHLLGVVGRMEAPAGRRSSVREVPSTWTMVHVLDRLEEAYEVLLALPARTRPKQYGNAMPTPVQERPALKDLLEMAEAGESFEEDRNRVRLAPTTAQITRMDQALAWPMEYLADRPDLAKAISLRALWAVIRADIRRSCQRRGLDHKLFNRQWQEGLKVVTATLTARRVTVN
jgi:hypothetical protein